MKPGQASKFVVLCPALRLAEELENHKVVQQVKLPSTLRCSAEDTKSVTDCISKDNKYTLPNLGKLLGVPPTLPGAIFDQLTAPRMQQMLRVQRHAVQEHGDSFQDSLETMSHDLFEV